MKKNLRDNKCSSKNSSKFKMKILVKFRSYKKKLLKINQNPNNSKKNKKINNLNKLCKINK